MIMAWLWNSMIPEITDTCMFLNSAKEIWNAMEQTYSKAKDATQIYDVKVIWRRKVKAFGVHSVTSLATLMIDVGSCMESHLVEIGDPKVVTRSGEKRETPLERADKHTSVL